MNRRRDRLRAMSPLTISEWQRMKLKKLAYLSASVFLTLGVLGATAFAETKWAPPAEIAGKAKEEAAAAGAPAAKADVEKTCAAEADAKALKGRARKHFVADCKKR
ncbi:MAG: hypothetical protein EBT19_02265 [Methylocystaceae bacterium]|nr:hypothetical protein [Methylocystaceae bacterium]NBV94225.1 hypothetical protein [Methylocystaceae bacterium]